MIRNANEEKDILKNRKASNAGAKPRQDLALPFGSSHPKSRAIPTRLAISNGANSSHLLSSSCGRQRSSVQPPEELKPNRTGYNHTVSRNILSKHVFPESSIDSLLRRRSRKSCILMIGLEFLLSVFEGGTRRIKPLAVGAQPHL